MTTNPESMPDLRTVAQQAMRDAGFAVDISADAASELAVLHPAQPGDQRATGVRDARALVWSSIDNPESRDLDQVEVAEQLPNGDIRLLVGIADVDALVPADSALDRYAAANGTSVYTGVVTFPMLPERLSTDLTSLLQDADRLAIVVEMVVQADGALRSSAVYRAWVRNRAKLDYATIGAWLEGHGALPPLVTPELERQLRLQASVAERLRARRRANGALDLETVEPNLVASGGTVTSLTVREQNRARDLIEDLMVSANSVIASFLETHGAYAIERAMRAPDRWPRIIALAAPYGTQLPAAPDQRALADFLAQRKQADLAHFPDLSLAVVKLLGAGAYTVVAPGADATSHFALAVQDYSHATAPNRRYADLVTQRMVKALLAHAPAPYLPAALAAIAERCNERDSAAKKVERTMRKVAATAFMADRIGETFDAIVTGAAAKGTFVRLLNPPVEGRVVRGEHGLDVGDAVRVRLLATDAARGFIDFERENN